MSASCDEFRRSLAEALSSRENRRELGWHEHLLGCAACRDLFQAEEVLDQLLASLPEPRLPRDLARRILVLLDRERAREALEDLLDRDPAPVVPPDLADRVLGRLSAERAAPDPRRAIEGPLHRLLGVLPEPAIPAGLVQRVLSGLEGERTVAQRARPFALPRRAPRTLVVVLAAGLLVALSLLFWKRRGDDPGRTTVGPNAEFLEVDPELLADLELLEDWELLMQEDLDLLLDDLDPVDLAILENRAVEEDEG